MIRVSMGNRVAGANITASSQDATYTAANIRNPQRPTLPAYTTVATDSWWTCDFQSAQQIDVMALIWANFTQARFQFNATDVWTSPSYDSGLLTIGQVPTHGRYHLFHRPASPQTFRFMRIFAPTQATVDGAGFFRLGGCHAGLQQTPLDDVLVDYQLTTVEPHIDVVPSGFEGWRRRLGMGPSYTRLHLSRMMRLGVVQGVSDDLAAWLTIEQNWNLADYALVSLRDDVTNWCWMMRRLVGGATWGLSSKIGTSDLELEELI